MKTNPTRILSLLLLVCLLALPLASCSAGPTATVCFENGGQSQSFTVKLSDFEEGATLYDVLKQDERLAAEMDETTTPYVTAICGYTPDAAKQEYIAVYASLAEFAFGASTFSHGEIPMYTTSVGVSELPLREGAVYMFRAETW